MQDINQSVEQFIFKISAISMQYKLYEEFFQIKNAYSVIIQTFSKADYSARQLHERLP